MIKKSPFRIARLQALKSASKFRVGCVLAQKGRIISCGHNDMSKTHPMVKANGGYDYLHAEMDACVGLRPYDVKGCNAYVYRAFSDGSPALAKPCEVCCSVLRRMGIRKVYYTTAEAPFWNVENLS